MRRVESKARPQWLRVLAVSVAALAMFALPAAAHAEYENVGEVPVPAAVATPNTGFSLDAVNGYFYFADNASTKGVFRTDLEGQQVGPALVPDEGARATATDPETGDLYVFQDGEEETEPGVFVEVPLVSRYTPVGVPIGSSWMMPGVSNVMSMLGTAVDDNGSVYTSTNFIGNSVVRFSSTGVAQGTITGEDASQLVAPSNVAVDSSEQVYVLDQTAFISSTTPGGRVQIFDSDGDFVELVATAEVTDRFQALTVNPGNGDVWVAEIQDVGTPEAVAYLVRYENEGGDYERTEEIEMEGITPPVVFTAWLRLAVDPESGTVYAFSSGNRVVQVYAEPEPPVVETGGASGISQTKATVNGEVDPSGQATTCHFLYGTAGGSLDKQVPCKNSPGSGEEPVVVSADLSSLSANTEYEFRLVAENDAGEIEGGVAEFKTLANTCATDSSLCPPPDPTPTPTPTPVPVTPAPPAPAPPAAKPLKCKKGFKKKKVKGKQKCVKVQKKKGKGKKK